MRDVSDRRIRQEARLKSSIHTNGGEQETFSGRALSIKGLGDKSGKMEAYVHEAAICDHGSSALLDAGHDELLLAKK